MFNLRMLKLSDAIIWFCVAFLLIMGCLAIFSSTSSLEMKIGGNIFLYLNKHIFAIIFGLFLMVFFTYIDYHHLDKFAYFIYAIVIAALFLVLFMGIASQGAQRWLSIGSFSFQPSEISKIVLIIVLAAYLKNKRGKIKQVSQLLPILMIVAVPFLLIFKQPDLGTSLVFIFITAGMLLWSEIPINLLLLFFSPIISLLLSPWFHLWLIYIVLLGILLFFIKPSMFDTLIILSINIGIGIAVPHIWAALKLYQRQRILSFLNPGADPLGMGYHSLQSKIAIGSGLFFGKGFLRGTQTQLQFIPEQHSDFIFSSIAEEFGFIGSTIIIVIFGIILWRIYKVALSASDPFGELLAMGILIFYSFHFLVNIGMVEGLLPVVGLPLPFLSFGGSFMSVNLICLGIIQSIAMRRQKLIF